MESLASFFGRMILRCLALGSLLFWSACTPPPTTQPPPTCPASQKLCNDACVFFDRDPRNCGACDKACPPQQACVRGACSSLCPSSQTLCSQYCVDLQRNEVHCGACGKACAASQICLAGECRCPASLQACGEKCVDLQSNPQHCGACDQSCPADQVCAQGRCLSTCPPTTPTLCFGGCVELSQNLQHCGACGHTCDPGEVCQEGRCSCPSGLSKCGKACLSLSDDPQNCGSCDKVCSDTTFCKDGICSNACPEATASVCFGACVDLQTNAKHCGSCGQTCKSDERCFQGLCQCQTGLIQCDGVCVDYQSNPKHCGRCLFKCDPKASCSEGKCLLPCASPLKQCEDTCIDTTTSPLHCGSCGTICASNERCSSSRCEVCVGPCKVQVERLLGSVPWRDSSLPLARFFRPQAILIDSQGTAYIADTGNHRIRKIDRTGQVTTIAGSGLPGYQDGPAMQARFRFPGGLALDAQGNLFVADINNHCIRKIDTQTGTVTTLAGGSGGGYRDGIATQALFLFPSSVLHLEGSVYVADTNNHRLRKIDSQGLVTTFAGTGTAGLKDGAADQALFRFPYQMVVDAQKQFYLADAGNYVLRKIDAQGLVTTLAGDGVQGVKDGPALQAQFRYPTEIALDPAGALYIADRNDHRIRKLDLQTNLVTTVAGTGLESFQDGPAPQAHFAFPSGLALDLQGNLMIVDRDNHRIRQLELALGRISTWTGDALRGQQDGPLDQARLNFPQGVTFDTLGNLYLSEDNRIRKLDTQGQVTTLAGIFYTGAVDGPAAQARFRSPHQLIFDNDGHLYIADRGNHKIRKLSSQGLVTTLAGDGIEGYKDGPADQAQFSGPFGLIFDKKGNLYVSEADNHTIRKIDPAGEVTTVAGLNRAGYKDGAANVALLNSPRGMAWDSQGNLLFADHLNHRIRYLDPQGSVKTLAGSGIQGFANGSLLQAQFSTPITVALDPYGRIFVLEYGGRLIRMIHQGQVSTYAGSGVQGFFEGPGEDARFWQLLDMRYHPSGSLYLVDQANHALFLIRP